MSEWSATPYLKRGIIALVVGLGGVVLWSFATEVEGAVIASGYVTVESRQQSIQHPDGGLIAELHVVEGSKVRAGDPILTLDGNELASQLAVTKRELIETLVRQDRLLAETAGGIGIKFRKEIAESSSQLFGLDVIKQERHLFDARKNTVMQTEAQLKERQSQTQAIAAGRERQLGAAEAQLALINTEIETQSALLEKGLSEAGRLSALRREGARLEGEIGDLEAGIAEARSAVAGFELELLRQRASFREAAQRELREVQPREAELRERLQLIETKIRRLTLRAPMSGTVLGLQANTVGGVLIGGAQVASIVPAEEPMVLSVQIEPAQIDRVFNGQEALVRFPHLNARTTPQLFATVRTVSADALVDPATGIRSFVAELQLVDEPKLDGTSLVPGMPVEVFLHTDTRTPASFLLKPLTDYWVYAMRDR